jgi:hypothetical protein
VLWQKQVSMSTEIVSELSNLKSEHEAVRANLVQVENALKDVENQLSTAPESRLQELKDKLFSLYNIFLNLRDGSREHMDKEVILLFSRQTSDIAAELEKEHLEMKTRLDNLVAVTFNALPVDATRQRIQESSITVHNVYYGVIDMVKAHIAREDGLIDATVYAIGTS